MKVTEVRAIPLAIPLAKSTPASPWAAGLARQILVRVTTDAGLVGWGECFAYGATLAVCDVVDSALAPLVVGQDPGQIEQLVDRMHRTLMIWGRRGLAMMAVSGVELALLPEGVAQVAMRFRIIWFQEQGLLRTGDRLVQTTFQPIEDAEIGVRLPGRPEGRHGPASGSGPRPVAAARMKIARRSLSRRSKLIS